MLRGFGGATGRRPAAAAGARPIRKGGAMTTASNSNMTEGGGHGSSRSYVPARPTIPIDGGLLADRYAKFELGARKIRWDDAGPVQVDWSLFDRSKLTLDNLLIVKLVTFV